MIVATKPATICASLKPLAKSVCSLALKLLICSVNLSSY